MFLYKITIFNLDSRMMDINKCMKRFSDLDGIKIAISISCILDESILFIDRILRNSIENLPSTGIRN